ncbi:unnamed protein product [Knipowitschia caucasica]
MEDIALDLIMDMAKKVVSMVKNMKANKERCKRVAKRVQSLLPLLAKLNDMDPRQISEVVRNALKELSATLANAENIMQKFHNCNTVKSFVFSSTHEGKFQKINERLDDSFEILTGAIHIENYEKLDDVWKAVSGKNEPAHPTQPFPIGFSNSCGPSPLPTSPTMPSPLPTSPTMPSPLPTYPTMPSPLPTYPTMPSPLPTSPTMPYPPQNVFSTTSLTSNMPGSVPAITVTNAPNPPYPPAQRPPAYNPNALMVPAMNTTIPCAMPPRVVTVPAPVRPVFYGPVAPRPQSVFPNTHVYSQAMAPQQVIVTVPRPQPQVLTNTGVATVYLNRPW